MTAASLPQPAGLPRAAAARPVIAHVQTKAKRLTWENAAIAAMIAYCLFPFYWLFKLSMHTGGAAAAGANIFPADLTLKNYIDVLSQGSFLQAFMNSVIIAGSATALALVVGGFAGYALARLPVPGKQYILFAALGVSMFPGISIVGPLFDLWRNLGLFDTKTGLVIPSVTFSLPMAIWILSAFFRELPKDLEQAAYMDGATPFQAFRKVMLPLAAPGVFTAAILVFISAWNEFLFAMTFTATDKARPVTAAIATFTGTDAYEIPVGSISAASIIVMVPLVFMVLAFQRRIVSGLTAGGVK